MPNSPPDLSIVIVHYRTPDLLIACLHSIYEHANGLNLEVIVVDNNSGDNTPDRIRQTFHDVILIASDTNHYFSEGNNVGIRAATGHYVLVLNPDMEIRGRALHQLIAALDSDPNPGSLGAITTALYFPDGRLQRNCSDVHTYLYLLINYTFLSKLLPGLLDRLNRKLWYTDWDRTTPREVAILPGSCICATPERWAQVGGFDPRLPMYFSDSYASDLWRDRGLRLKYVITDGIIHHEGSATRDETAPDTPSNGSPAESALRKRYRPFALRMYLRDLITYTRLRFGLVRAVMLAILLIPTWFVQRLRS